MRQRINASCLLNTETPARRRKHDRDHFLHSPAIASTAAALTFGHNIFDGRQRTQSRPTATEDILFRRPTEVKRKLTRWEKITVISANLCAIAMMAYFPAEFLAQSEHVVWPRYVVLAVYLLSTEYLVTYSLWHWRTRYAGNRPFAWAAFFPLSAFALPALFYYAHHIRPDIRQEGAYAPSAPKHEPPLPLPPKYEVVKSLSFVGGWILVYWAIFATTVTGLTYAIALPMFADCIRANVAKEFSKKIGDALVSTVHVWASSITLLCLACGAAVIGSVLLYASQRMKWRLATEGTPSLAEKVQLQAVASRESRQRFLFRLEQYFRKPAWFVGKVVAGCLILLVSLGVLFWLTMKLSNESAANTSSSDTSVAGKEKSVVVAFGDLASGSILTTNNLAKKSFSFTNWTTYVVEPDQHRWLLGLPINRSVKHGQPIYWPDVLPPTNSAVRLSK